MKKWAAMLAMFWAANAGAATVGYIGIAAVVNDQVISTVDVGDRLALVMGTTGIGDTQENRARLAPQILRQLVDEKLQMQEAAREGVTISDEQVKEGIARLERQNGKATGSLEEFLDARGLSKSSFHSQIRAQLAWAQLIYKKVRPKIRISDQEVARYVRRSASTPTPARGEEVQIATILLPAEGSQGEAEVKRAADRLAQEIRGGASFEAVSGQFSGGGAKAGAPFWVERAQLDPAISQALRALSPGAITDPVRTASGYQIVKLLSVRQGKGAPLPEPEVGPRAEFLYKEILMALRPDAPRKEAELLLQLAQEVKKSPGKCDALSMAGAGDLETLDFQVALKRETSDHVTEKLRGVLMPLHVGEVSDPVITPQGIRLFMMCERVDLPAPKAAAPSDDAVRQALYEEKLDLEAQKYLRNLRREAFIEVRAPH